MSVLLQIAGVVQKPKTVQLTTTNKTDLLTISDKVSEKIVSISVANESAGTAIPVALYWHDGTNDHVFWVGEVPAQSTSIISDLPILLNSKVATEKIKGQAGTANQISVTLVRIIDFSAQGGGGLPL